MDEKAIAERVAARHREAGGTVFYLKKNPMKNYQKYVERMLPKWFSQSGEYPGIFIKGSILWKSPEIDTMMGIAIAHYFTFKQEISGGELSTEEGKVTARIQGNDIYMCVMLYD